LILTTTANATDTDGKNQTTCKKVQNESQEIEKVGGKS
jgi:hypothetical protein